MSFEKNLSVPFGKATKNVLYYLDSNMRFTNHGSYGTAPKLILERKREYQAEMERCPDRWFRFTSFGKWNESLQALSDYLKVDKANLLLFENATEAINTVLKWVEVDGGSKDAILTTAINYQAILNAIDYTAKYRLKPENHVNVVKMNIKFPIPSVDDFVKQFDDTCRDIVENKKLRLRVAVIDHIASSTAIMYPIEAITKVIRKWAGSKCIIIIDGAHSLGQTKLDFSPEKFHADFYVSNLHKWFLAPRSCAFLYTSKKANYDQNFQPCYISHGYVNQTVSYNHFQRGTTDKTSLYVVPECINFYENYLGGLDHIRQYTDPLLNRAVEMLEREWGTKRLQVPTDMLAPFMRVVKLPELPEYRLEKGRIERDLCNKATVGLIKHLMDKYNVVAFIGIINDELYCRITCFVYQEMDDYIALKDAILKIKNGD